MGARIWRPLPSLSALFAPALSRQGSRYFRIPALSRRQIYHGASFGHASPPLPTSNLCLLISMRSNDLMDQTYIKAATRLRDKMVSLSSPSPTPFRGISDPISTAPPWQACAPVIRHTRSNRKTDHSRSWSADSANALSWRCLSTKTVPTRISRLSRDAGFSTFIPSHLSSPVFPNQA